MSRGPIALLAGILGFLLYVGLVVAVADWVLLLPWYVQAVYFITAGIVWVWPAKRLMFWAARVE